MRDFGWNIAAQSELGYRYVSGTGVPQDHLQAEKWLRRAPWQRYAPS